AGALGPGDLLLAPLGLPWRGESERAIFAIGAGLAAETFVVLAVGSAGFLTRAVCLGVLGVGLVCTLFSVARACRRVRQPPPPGIRFGTRIAQAWRDSHWALVRNGVLAVVLAAFLYVALLGALGPEIGSDARVYHLGSAHSYV